MNINTLKFAFGITIAFIVLPFNSSILYGEDRVDEQIQYFSSDEDDLPQVRLSPLTLEHVSFAELATMSIEDFKTMQGKLTYVGTERINGIFTVVILTGSDSEAWRALDHGVGRFDNFRMPGINYSSDENIQYGYALLLQPEEFKELMFKIGKIHFFTGTTKTEHPYLSVAFLNAANKKAIEVILDKEVSKETVTLLREIVKTTRNAKTNFEVSTKFAAKADLLTDKRAIDVTDKISVETTPLILSKPTPKSLDFYESIAKLTNCSTETIVGPVSLVLELKDEGIRGDLGLNNRDGKTRDGYPYINLPLQNNSLLPNESIEVKLVFSSMGNEEISFRTRVLSGEGER